MEVQFIYARGFYLFFLFVLYFCHMSCGRKVQLRAQLSGAWEGKGGEPRRCFPRDSRPGRGAGDQESGECGLSNRESVTGGCWSRLRAPCQDCELWDLDRRHHDPHRPPRQGPPTVSCLVFLSFFRHPPPFMPIVTTSWLQLTLIGTKICQNTSILWNIRLYNSLRTSWSGYVGEMMHDKDLQLDQKRTWLTLMLPADTWSWVEELFWATESKLVGLHYTSIQCTDGLTVGVWAAIIALLSSISCCYPDPTIHLAFNSFYLTWCLSYWWQDLSIKKFCVEQGLMVCRHFCWLFSLFQSNFISSARSAF